MATKFRVHTDGNIFIVQEWKDNGWGRRKWIDVTPCYKGPSSSFFRGRAYFRTLLDAQEFIIRVIRVGYARENLDIMHKAALYIEKNLL